MASTFFWTMRSISSNSDGAESHRWWSNEADQERHKGGERKGYAGVEPQGLQGNDDDQEDDRHGRKEDGEGDLIGGFLPSCPFHQIDHAIKEAFAGLAATRTFIQSESTGAR